MPLSVHKITARQLQAIADGSSTATDLDILLASQRSKCLAMLALIARMATAARHPQAALAAEGWQLLTRVQRQAPNVVEDLLCYPALGTWATETVLGLNSRSVTGAPPGRLALFAAAAAIRSGLPCVIELPPSFCSETTLNLPTLGNVLLPGELRDETVVVRSLGATTEIAGRCAKVTLPARLDVGAPGWHPVSMVSAGEGETRIRLVLDDVDPYRFAGFDVPLERLTAPRQRDWRRRIAGGWRLLVRHHQKTAAEVRYLISAVTPLMGAGDAMRSITSRHSFGTVALSLPKDDVAMALTLSHEVQHAKLSALMDLLPMVTEPTTALYYAPWRPDPRPLASLLQGMYAHLEVARFWRRHREVTREPAEMHYANIEYARWRKACAQVAEVLCAQPQLTRSGSLFVAGMTNVLRSWRHDYVPTEAQAEADRAISIHRRWSAPASAGKPGPGVSTDPHASAPSGAGRCRAQSWPEAVKTSDGGRQS